MQSLSQSINQSIIKKIKMSRKLSKEFAAMPLRVHACSKATFEAVTYAVISSDEIKVISYNLTCKLSVVLLAFFRLVS